MPVHAEPDQITSPQRGLRGDGPLLRDVPIRSLPRRAGRPPTVKVPTGSAC
ncbi:hypothetical protein [Streptosporangium sp. NPDC000509]|uniref:hypothetical protein n=1 Tax=Streptosporangium sp. NPDC000509 TaxID=3366186 RepID=UPI00367ED3D9